MLTRWMFAFCFLIPVCASAQKTQVAALSGLSVLSSESLGAGFGAHALGGLEAVRSAYIIGGLEVMRFDRLQKIYVPLTVGVLYNPVQKQTKIVPLGLLQAGYGWYQDEISGGNVKGGAVAGVFGGVKTRAGNLHPYLLIGYAQHQFNSYMQNLTGSSRWRLRSTDETVNIRVGLHF